MGTPLKAPITFETTFANYSATSIVGEGGSGTVYKATDDTGGDFAIKVLDPDKANREKVKRFKNELNFCLRNQHANILTVQDHGVYHAKRRSTPFYVMPFYAGSLRSLMSEAVSADAVLRYFGQILDGIEAAHLRRVFHRDVKPENVLFDSAKDSLLMADFGIAHFSEAELQTLVETSPGSRLANFQYAAPEQRARGQKVDHRADIFALGLVLNELFTGEVPQGTGYRTIESKAPQFAYLDDLVASMIRQSPADRPASIEIVKQQLIAHKNEFITLQRISALKETVVPVGDLDDPLILEPIKLIGFDWDRNVLTLVLSQPVNAEWVRALHNMGSHTSAMGKEPERFRFSGDRAIISTDEDDVQRVINYFKDWLPLVANRYEQTIRFNKQEAELAARRKLQADLEAQERRRRVLKNVKI